MKHLLRPIITIIAFVLMSGILPEAALAAVQIDPSSGLMTIPVRVKGIELRAIVDTGANVIAIDSSEKHLVDLNGESKTLNFSDRGGVKAPLGATEIEVDGKKFKAEVVVTKTQLSKSCCAVILGKPFFDANRVHLDFATSTLAVAPKILPSGRKHLFTTRKSEKEIVIPCTVNGQKTSARLDLGSQQALDVTGEFAAKLSLFDQPETIALDSMLQPGLAITRVHAKCASLAIPAELPALVHPISQTGLGHGPVGLNIGAPILKRHSILFDLPASKITFIERTPLPPVAFNSLHAFFADGPDGKVFTKAVLAGGGADDLGLKIGDKVLKLNGNEVKSAEEAYSLIEEKPLQKFMLLVERDGLPLTLQGDLKALLPRKTSYAQSFYGLSSGAARTPSYEAPKIMPQVYRTARFRYEAIDADFSVGRLLDGLSVRDFLFERFQGKVFSVDDGYHVEGLKVGLDGSIRADRSKTRPSLSFGCEKVDAAVDAHWIGPALFRAKHTLKGCSKEMTLVGTYQLEALEALAPAGQWPALPFLFLHDKLTGHVARWKRHEVVFALDTSAPAWVAESLESALKEYNSVLGSKLKLSFVRQDLMAVPIADPQVFGLYWTKSGHPYDKETRFAQAMVSQDTRTGEIIDADLVLRAPEFLQHELLVRQIATEAAARSAPEERIKFENFASAKIDALRKNVVIHELGHLLGLGHNFSEAEKSVMSYATITTLSEYDKAALRYHYADEKPSRPFDLAVQPNSLGYD